MLKTHSLENIQRIGFVMRILIKYIVRNDRFGVNNPELVVGIWMGFMLGSTHLICGKIMSD